VFNTFIKKALSLKSDAVFDDRMKAWLPSNIAFPVKGYWEDD